MRGDIFLRKRALGWFLQESKKSQRAAEGECAQREDELQGAIGRVEAMQEEI